MEKGISSSMLRKLTGFITRHKEGEITPGEANQIQKTSYALNNTIIKKKFSPTYETIVLGLDSEEKQIFESTVYYLTRIAQNKPKYKKNIIKEMQLRIDDKELNPEFRNILKQYIKLLDK